MCLLEALDLFEGVAPDWISEVLLCILHPTVQCRSLLGKLQVELLDLKWRREWGIEIQETVDFVLIGYIVGRGR